VRIRLNQVGPDQVRPAQIGPMQVRHDTTALFLEFGIAASFVAASFLTCSLNRFLDGFY
jgi:hypothetical protein